MINRDKRQLEREVAKYTNSYKKSQRAEFPEQRLWERGETVQYRSTGVKMNPSEGKKDFYIRKLSLSCCHLTKIL